MDGPREDRIRKAGSGGEGPRVRNPAAYRCWDGAQPGAIAMKRHSDKPAQHVLDLLEAVKSSGDGYTALCPAHYDHNSSLSVAAGIDGRALIFCHAGVKPRMFWRRSDSGSATFSRASKGKRNDAGKGRSDARNQVGDDLRLCKRSRRAGVLGRALSTEGFPASSSRSRWQLHLLSEIN